MMRFILMGLFALFASTAFASDARTCGYPNIAFVNGINTVETIADDTGTVLFKELSRSLPDIATSGTQLRATYNHSGGSLATLKDVIESLYQKGASYGIRTERVSLLIYGATSGRNQHLRDAEAGFWGDIKQALSAIVGTTAQLFVRGIPAYDKTLLSIVDKQRALLQSAPGIYTIAHSQGTLFANDAFHVLGQQELAPGQDKMLYSGGYFVAPAANSAYAPFVNTDYTKLYTDFLARAFIGMPGNVSLYNNQSEEDQFSSQDEDVLNHGMISTYVNVKLSGVGGEPVLSPPHARLYHRVVGALVADVQRLKKPCEGDTWATPISQTEEAIYTDGLWVRDAFFCSEYAADFLVSLPATRSQCAQEFPRTVIAPQTAQGPMALNFEDACNVTNGVLTCALEHVRDSGPAQGTYQYFLGGIKSGVLRTCPADTLEVRNTQTDARQCLTWTDTLPRIQAI